MAERLIQRAARGLRVAGIGALSLVSLSFWSGPAAAERKVALVIGNAAYAGNELANPVNDATAVGARLKELGFEVILARDVNQQAMRRAIADFADRLSDDATGLFFFAGHGLQVNGRNFLVPVGSTVSSEARVVLEAIDLDLVLEQMTVSGSKVSVAILDACRNNPFERKVRGASAGLAHVTAPEGLLIAYATAPGKTAHDGTGKHGVYTEALLRHLGPGGRIEDVLKRVRIDVVRATKGQQVPWESSSLVGDLYLGAPGSEPATAPAPATGTTLAAAPAAPKPAARPRPRDVDLAVRFEMREAGGSGAGGGGAGGAGGGGGGGAH